ncbi:MAG: 2'-deoxycytidine 5'-triphosphate deaminase [Alphaproteobacteria bacterium]
MSSDQQDSRRDTGVLPYQSLMALIRDGEIAAAQPITSQQVQPASLDLRLGTTAYRMRASFLPGPNFTVQEQIENFGLYEIDLTNGALLETGCVYLVPLQESLALSDGLSGVANPKSSTGRLDVFTRLITDQAPDFDVVTKGYRGPLFAEIFPRTFSVIVRTGTRLNQLRLSRGTPDVREAELKRLLRDQPVLDRDLTEREVNTLFRGVPLSVDLAGIGDTDLVGFKAKPHAPLIDVDKIGHYDPVDYWDPIYRDEGRSVILNPDDFYILASKEAVSVPVDHAAEMVPYDAFTGEFRAHYAGFFDPGFGHADVGAAGTRAVLEVRSYGVPFIIEDGQLVGRLKYEHLTDTPDQLYGAESGSSYQRQSLALSKHFQPWNP